MMRSIWLSLLSLVSLLVARAVAGSEFGTGNYMGLFSRQASQVNLQTFRGALGGATAPAITKSQDFDRPFEVDSDTFTDFQSAAQRSCDNQKNACAQVANEGNADFDVGNCDTQNNDCKQSATSATLTSFFSLTSSNDQFETFCDN